MTIALSQRIAIEHDRVYRQGVKPCLIVLGRMEERQPQEPTATFLNCWILIDRDSKSRCEIYGQLSCNNFS